jgi:thiosulfate/3-mercaptopyruvate sulfurtransferase
MTDPNTSQASGPLVSPAWLADNLHNPTLVILDIRSAVDGGGRAAFEAAHVPGAVHTDYAKDGWRATVGMASGMLPEAQALATLIGSIGLAPAQHVVIVPAGVSAGDFSAAARVYWTLKTAGHQRQSILDGGFAAWRSDLARPVEAGAGRARTAGAYPVRLDARYRAALDDVEQSIARHGATLVDTRSKSYFEGREKSPQARIGGRLPGALNEDHAAAYDPALNRLRTPDALSRLLAQVPDGPTISYCNTGHQAATTWFVLSEILGRPDATLYDGSMSEWTQDPTRPVAAGAG